jgi:hypothetical protein
MEKRTVCTVCGSRIDDQPEPHECIGERIPRPGTVIGVALEDSIEDPFTGEVTVRVRLL